MNFMIIFLNLQKIKRYINFKNLYRIILEHMILSKINNFKNFVKNLIKGWYLFYILKFINRKIYYFKIFFYHYNFFNLQTKYLTIIFFQKNIKQTLIKNI